MFDKLRTKLTREKANEVDDDGNYIQFVNYLNKEQNPLLLALKQPPKSFKETADKFTSFLKLAAAPFLAIKDDLWFGFQPVEKSFSALSNFARYSLVHHYFSDALIRQFNQKKITLIGAVDYWFWESLLFTTAKENSPSSS